MSELGFEGLTLVGDELHFDGELVAILTNNASATSRGRFTDLVIFGEPGEEDCGCPVRLHRKDCDLHKAEDGTAPDAKDPRVDPYDDALDDVVRAAGEYARGGLLRMTDLATVARKLKESE